MNLKSSVISPKVLNFKSPGISGLLVSDPSHYVLIDRRTLYGNPYVMGSDGDRDEVCDKHEKWLNEWIKNGNEVKLWVRDTVFSNRMVVLNIGWLRLKNLVCHCVPERCHGNFLLRLANK